MKEEIILNVILDKHAGANGRAIVANAFSSTFLPALSQILCAVVLLYPLAAVAQIKRGDGGGAPRTVPDSISGTLNLTSSLGKTIHLPAPAASIFVAGFGTPAGRSAGEHCEGSLVSIDGLTLVDEIAEVPCQNGTPPSMRCKRSSAFGRVMLREFRTGPDHN